MLAIPFFLLIFGTYLLWRRNRMKRIGSPQLIKRLQPTYAPLKTYLRFTALLIAFALGCLALANPRQREESTADSRKGIDIVVALDVSRSMLANDVAPDRLTRAKTFINRLAEKLPDDRIGFVIFAGTAYMRTPLTFDRSATRMFVGIANPESVNQPGTNIDSALSRSLQLFGEESERFKSVILITDGESHAEASDETVGLMADRGIMINTVGIGSEAGATLTDSSGGVKKDNGTVVVSRLNEALLQTIAQKTNGRYQRLDDIDAAVSGVQQQLSGIEKKALGDVTTYSYQPLYASFALPMLLLLIAEIFIPDRKRQPK